MRVNHQHQRAFYAGLSTLHSAADMGSLAARVTDCLSRIFPCELASFDLLDLTAVQWNTVVTWPAMPQMDELVTVLQQFAHEHPIISHARHHACDHAIRTSDVLSWRQYRNLGVYHDFYRVHVMGVNRQLAFVAKPAPGLTLGVSLNRRGRDFTDGQRAQLEMLRPHLLQAYALAREHARLVESMRRMREDAAAAVSGGLCEVCPAGGVEWMTAAVEPLLMSYFPGWQPGLRKLPSALLAPLQAALRLPRKKSTEAAAAPGQTWSFPRAGGTLKVRLAARLETGRWQLLLTEAVPDPSAAALAARFGLAPRVAETLYWVGQSKTNEEISLIMGISPLTVKEYVSRLLEKLGVYNRVAAVRLAFEK